MLVYTNKNFNKMKTLKQIKEEVAKEYDFDSYLEMIDYEDGFDICIIDEIANRHAKEQLRLHIVRQKSELLFCKCETPNPYRLILDKCFNCGKKITSK